MTRQKEIGYEVGNVAWHNLDGYQELWNKSDFETKEKIVNEQGRLAIELSIPLVSKRNWFEKLPLHLKLLLHTGVGVLLGLTIAYVC